ncbi:hypothetical protein BRADI_2g52342v3 [Brachypodium distachyon]|uniref:Uncharacterized protein n=1 Tax=Brachypodium distachyon TaxID=15368 RepID=A0A0Q3KGD5_BRADI|nr:hypothetical protein BRADI_2g52342v3 [Brachypodium distachyon]
MRRFLPLCALLLVMLCLASLMEVTEGKVRAGGRAGGAGRSGSPRSLSGGTWAACVGSSLLAAAAMLL